MKPEIEESTQYESLIGVKEDTFKQSTLSDFLGIDDADESREWEKHWIGMPEYTQEDNPPYKKLIVSFRCKEDYEEFSKLIDQNLTVKTKSIWHPKLNRDENSLRRWIEEDD